MKKRILIALISLLFSIASFNAICEKNVNDICLNQVGGVAIYCGITGESSVTTYVGSAVAGLGGAAIANGAGALMGFWVVSNPVGWIVGGAIAVL